MRAFLTFVSFILLLQSQVLAQSSCAIHVASFNIHYIVPHDKNENWEERKTAVTKVLKKIDADIIVFQEMETFEGRNYSHKNLQLDWINTTTGYQNAATGNPNIFPSTQPILYKPAKFIAVDQGFFFFSETPDVIYSRQWNGGYPYCLMQISRGFDHKGYHQNQGRCPGARAGLKDTMLVLYARIVLPFPINLSSTFIKTENQIIQD